MMAEQADTSEVVEEEIYVSDIDEVLEMDAVNPAEDIQQADEVAEDILDADETENRIAEVELDPEEEYNELLNNDSDQ